MNPDELVSFERALPDGRRLIAIASGELERQANSLLETLAALDAKGPRLVDKLTVQFGWSRLTIRQHGPAPVLHVHEPDFQSDPQHATVAHVERTLRGLRDQVAMLQLTGEAPRDFFFWQTFVCENGALHGEEVYFERREPIDGNDSGWFAGNAAADAAKRRVQPADLQTLPIHRLFGEFPAACPLLTLPVGFMGVFRWGDLVALFRSGGTPVQLPDAPG